MSDLTSMPNIGKTLADRLASADINTSEELDKLGAKQAFKILRVVYPKACINHLYAMEGAVQKIRWHNLSIECKKELKEFYDSLE